MAASKIASLRNFVAWRGVVLAQRARRALAMTAGVPSPSWKDLAPEKRSAPPEALRIDLRGKVAVVTGATGELGRVISRTLARCGADVALHYHRNREGAERLRGEIEALGVRAVIVTGDVGDAPAVEAMRDRVHETLGPVDIVVANAVQPYGWSSVLEQSVEDYESQFRTCVLQNVLLAKAFVPGMIARGGGRVVAINTECAMQTAPGQSAYVAGKRGMDGMLRVLAREVGRHGITVNQVAPGWMVSERHRASGTERQPEYERNVPLGRRGDDQDVANAVAFLASDLAGFVTGVFLPVCGGHVMPAI